MPKLEYRGIIARPGTYMYEWGPETKTWEELKRAFQRTQEIKLTLGHPMTPSKKPRLANEEDYLGRLIPVVNEAKQVIEGIFKFHEEDWNKIPEHIRNKIVNDEAISISAGYPPPKMVDGVQTGILYDHYAILAQGEDPICPLGECGINVRVESGDGEYVLMRYEQATETKDSEELEPEETTPKEPQFVTRADLDRFQETLLKSVSDLLQPKEEAGAEPEEEELVTEPEEEPPRPEPPLEPERAFPAGSAKSPGVPGLKEDGSVEIPPDVYLGKVKNK